MSAVSPLARARTLSGQLPAKFRNRIGRVRWHRWRTRPYRSTEQPIVIGGSPRSGTTLLRRLLDAHPRIVCGAETGIFLPGRPPVDAIAWGYDVRPEALWQLVRRSPSQAAFIEAFFRSHGAKVGKPRWSEKTPLNVAHLPWIWEHFPEARFVHVIRDGRDVVCSMRTHPDRRFVDGKPVTVPRPPEPVDSLIRRWVTSTGQGMAHRRDPRYREVRYEELVERPREVITELLTWLGESFEESILSEREGSAEAGRRGAEWDARAPIQSSSVGRWRTDLSPEDLDAVRRVATVRLVELGYADGPSW
jgi:protein-tyrosine sulfotransferase